MKSTPRRFAEGREQSVATQKQLYLIHCIPAKQIVVIFSKKEEINLSFRYAT